MLRPIVRPVTQPIAFSLNGRKPFHVPTYLLGRVIDIIGDNEGAVFDVAAAFARNAIWEDSARTTPASVDGPVGSIQDELLRYYAEQATSGARPVLRTDGAGKYWLEGDGTKYLLVTLGTALTNPALVAAVRPTSLTATIGVAGPRNDNDTAGGYRLATISSVVQFSYRIPGGQTSGSRNSLGVGVDEVRMGRFEAGAAIASVNGVDGSPSSGSPIINTTTERAIMALNTSGSAAFIGRLYAYAEADLSLSPADIGVINRWAALRAGVVLP